MNLAERHASSRLLAKSHALTPRLRTANVDLRASHQLVLGSLVWLAYAADRWIEGWRLAAETTRTQHHYYDQRARWPLAIDWFVVLAVVRRGGQAKREAPSCRRYVTIKPRMSPEPHQHLSC